MILTKLDGDARGGAALSVKEVVGRPIAFASTGEKLEDFELFHPDRLAGRILGMGDVLTLIEKAEEVYETDQAEEAAQRLMEGTFTLDDFLDQMQAIKKMGPLSSVIGMLPGIPKEVRDVEIDDKEIGRVEAHHPLDDHRRSASTPTSSTRRAATRIAKGSGTQPTDVAQLLSQFKEMRKMMQQMGQGTIRKMKKKSSKKKGKGGGRITPKGSMPQAKKPFTLPGLDPLAEPDGEARASTCPSSK